MITLILVCLQTVKGLINFEHQQIKNAIIHYVYVNSTNCKNLSITLNIQEQIS